MCTTARTFRAFALGTTVATPGVLAALARNNASGQDLLQRHSRGDWGQLDPEDVAANDWGRNDRQRRENRLDSIWFGPSADFKQSAWQGALELAGMN